MPESIFLNGSIPAAIGDLSELEHVDFSRISSLEGTIPPQLLKLKKLQSLQISQTQVSGPVPHFLSELASLKGLELRYNRLSGPIPASLGNLVHLTSLTLSGNRLTGAVPASLFSKLPKGSLASLALSENKLTGNRPQVLRQRPLLQRLPGQQQAHLATRCSSSADLSLLFISIWQGTASRSISARRCSRPAWNTSISAITRSMEAFHMGSPSCGT
ncbi:polygalacturonase inhibitor-like [Iris pallida]|uniref:Polygalacturonase inhibitor-like n=1 Tax=Iris pallida TaxID=29817 RepID=A0AAX6EJD1_IRIPA|nr:polygalacturonase inhibitor-like [Iris pallida]